MTNLSKTLLAVSLAGVGCVADDPDLGTDESGIYVHPNTQLWHGIDGRGNRDIPVCWEPGQAPTAWDGFAAEQAIVIDQFKRSWQAVSGVRLVERGACPTSGSELMIRLRNRGYDTANTPGAAIGGSAKGEGVASLMAPAIGIDTMSVAIELPVQWNLQTDRYERSGSDDRLRYIAGHELGHVLGFAHEHEHDTDPRAADCRAAVGGGPAPGSSVTGYDPESIMNYCQSGGNNSGTLSALDIQGARKLYGWRDATDYNNDGASELAIFRTSGPLAGQWFIANLFGGFQYGEPGDVPLTGDFDNDGTSDVAVWRPAGPWEGWWFIVNSTGGETRFQWGANGDIPTTGDLDGDGHAEFIVFRPSTSTFYIREQTGATRAYGPWGEAGDIPVLADYDGDGKTDLALFRPYGAWAGSWFVLDSSTPGSYRHVVYGTSGDLPVVGDFDGDRRSDLAVFRPSNGWWYVNTGVAEIRRPWGIGGDVPVSLDYDGDGITELSVWRPSTGTWYIRTPARELARVRWGEAGDIPLGRTIR